MSSVLSMFGIGDSAQEKSKRKQAEALETQRLKKKRSTEKEATKLRVATKLALLESGAGGAQGNVDVGRKKLLGN